MRGDRPEFVHQSINDYWNRRRERSRTARKTKYKYDIQTIEELVNIGYSVRHVARLMGWCQTSTQKWVKRNFDKKVKFVRKEGD